MAETSKNIKLGGQTYLRTSDMIVKTLHKPTFNATTETMHDETGANYQVPTGKIFRLLLVHLVVGTSGAGDSTRIRNAATLDTADGSIVFVSALGQGVVGNFKVAIDFAADTFPTIEAVSAQTSTVIATGIEMDL